MARGYLAGSGVGPNAATVRGRTDPLQRHARPGLGAGRGGSRARRRDRAGSRNEARDFALAWVLSKPFVTSPIIGTSKPHHLDDALAALALKLDEKTIVRLEEQGVGPRRWWGTRERFSFARVDAAAPDGAPNKSRSFTIKSTRVLAGRLALIREAIQKRGAVLGNCSCSCGQTRNCVRKNVQIAIQGQSPPSYFGARKRVASRSSLQIATSASQNASRHRAQAAGDPT